MSNIVNSSILNISSTTPLQEGMIYHYLMNPKTTSYVVQTVFDVQGALDVKLVENALDLLIMRHVALRTAIVCNKVSRPLQVVLKSRKADFAYIDCTQKEEQCKVLLEKEVERGFDLQKDSLMRTRCVKIGEDHYKLAFTYHHVIMDGWCISIFLGDFLRYYKELSQGKTIEQMCLSVEKEAAVAPSYLDYIDWLEQVQKEEGYQYWKKRLDGYENVVDVPSLGMAEPCREESKRIGITIKQPLGKEITQLSTAYQVTSNTVFETAWGLLLQSFHYVDDVVFGKSTSGRNIPIKDAESILGMFINTIPVRVHTEENTKICELLDNMQKQSEESAVYEQCSLAEIQSHTKQKGDLIRTLFVYENYFVDSARLDVDLPFTLASDSSREQTSYDFNLIAYQTVESYRIEAMYNPSCYTDSEVQQVLQRMEMILDQMTKHPDMLVKDLSTTTWEDVQTIKKKFNTSAICEDQEFDSIRGILAKQAMEQGEKVALVSGDEKVTYFQLKNRVDALSLQLQELGIGIGDFVAIMAKRSIEMIVGIYAVVNIGAVYVPIDPECPADRVAYMLRDAGPKAVLVYDAQVNTDIMVLDLAVKYEEREQKLEVLNTEEERLVSCIYTSGTTGKPKGVLNYERGLFNTLHWMKRQYALMSEDVILQKTNYTFDVSETEIFLFALIGASLVIPEPEAEKDPVRIAQIIEEKNVTVVNFVPSMLNIFLAAAKVRKDMAGQLRSLKYVFVAGEALDKNTVVDFYAQLEKENSAVRLVNVYGPTEASVYATYYDCFPDTKKVLIGKPIDHCNIFIVANEKLCGINTPGELCIAGAGVAKGYLRQDALTKQKFIKNPFGEGMLYRSGDLARWMSDGTIEYLGRMDDQVKVRGFRIELGEIESHIRKQQEVENCVVIVAEDQWKEKIICAYIEAEHKVDIKKLERDLAQVLPSYMMPTYITQIDRIPLNQNGKLDRSALVIPSLVCSVEYAAPRTELEKTVCTILERVLGEDRIGIYDDFFEIGGHSLRAARLVNQLEAEIGVHMDLRNVFVDRTAANMAKRIASMKRESYEPIPVAEEKSYYPMSSVQKRIYLVSQMDTQGVLYNMAQGITLGGEVSRERIEDALNEMIKRHEILRTAFLMIDGEPVQKILAQGSAAFTYVEDSTSTEEELLHAFIQPFDLSSGSLVRMQLVKREESYLLFFDFHHIITDGMSTGMFMKEFMALYNGEPLGAEVRQYKDYSEWMRTQELSVQRNYWMTEFEGEIPVLELPLDYKRPSERSYHGAMVHGASGKKIYDTVRHLACISGTTEYMILLSGLMVVLGKYSRQEDIIIGSPVNGRIHGDTEKMLGMFVNTLALRGKPEKTKSFMDFLKEMKEICLKAYENQAYPFEELISNIDVKEDMSRNPLFDVMFVLQNNENVDFSLYQSKVEGAVAESKVAKFDITFNIMEVGGEYHIDLEYSTDIFKEESMKWMLTHYLNILAIATQMPETLIGDMEEAGQEEKECILNIFNEKLTFGDDQTITKLLLAQAERMPDNTAVIFKEEEITYRELVRRAGVLAHKLRSMGIQSEDKVALLTERSIEMIVAVYGVLLAEAAYVPIDPSYPEDRIQYILEDCDAKAVIQYQNKMEVSIPNIVLDEETWEGDVVTECGNQPENLAYIIYTSGSTGKPKGVMLEHAGVSNLIQYFRSDLAICPEDRVLLFANYAFDGSVWEMMMALSAGAALVIPDEETIREPKMMEAYLEQKEVTISYFPPAYFEQSKIGLEKYVITAGSTSSKEVVKKAVESCGYINSYGPTEVTVCATNWECKKGGDVPHTIPIGKPIRNKRVYIMEQEKICGILVPGEICVSGKGIARGYLGEEELTRDKFGVDAYTGVRLYRTGDLGRWLPDGNIEFLGRIDDQVKIRGYRIEIGEIENVIKEIDMVRESVVIIRETEEEEKYICAYYVADIKIPAKEVKARLEKVLPEYMIPSRMLQVERIPVTRNGKVNKEALPDIQAEVKEEYVAPRSKEEKALCDCFADVLSIPLVGIKMNFFERGGDSIKAMRVVSKMRDMGYEIAIKDIMQGKVPEKIALSTKLASVDGVDQREVVGPVVNTPMLREFFHWNLEKPWHFNQSIMLPVVNNVERIQAALDEVVKHHDILRAVCRDGRLIIQSFRRSKKYDFIQLEFENTHDVVDKVDAACTAVQESINLSDGPLMKAVFIRIEQECYLMLALHHLVVDTTSWEILAEDFNTAMTQLEKKEPIQLPNKTVSFKQWAKQLEEYKEKQMDSQEKEYWKEKNSKIKESHLDLGCEEGSDLVENVTVFLKKSDTKRLQYQTMNAFGTSTNELLLAAFALAVNHMTNQKSIAINLEKHGREHIGKEMDITRTVGWFTCTCPILIECSSDIKTCIVETKDMMRNIPNGGIGFGLIQEECQLELADIYFNYVGEVDTNTDTSKSIFSRTGMNSALENRLPGDLNVMAHEHNGRINIDFIFNQKKYSKTAMQAFANMYKQCLLACIDYCVEQKENVLTKTDVFADIAISDIDIINSFL